MLASQQELSGVQVASYLMNWDDHYTTHRFQGLFLIQTERFLQTQLNETRAQQKLDIAAQDVIDNDMYDDEAIDNDNNEEEHFQIQSAEHDKKYVLVNTRIDYQYRSDNLNRMCLYDFVSIFYKKKMNTTDLKYLSKIAGSIEEKITQKGRPPNERFLFQKQHPQATAYLMMKYSESHVPVLYGPQIPRQDRDDTRERYCRAILTLFVPWRTVADICDISQTWEDAFKSRQHLILSNSWTIIENIQLLHECKKDRDDHLLQVIAEAQIDNGLVDPVLIPTNQVDGEYGTDDSDDLLELLAPTGIAAAEIDGMTIHSFLGEQRNSGKARTIKPGDLKLEKEWALVEYLLIDEISMVGLTLLAKLNRIICAAKHTDPQVPFGGVNVIFFGDYLQYRPVYDVPLHTDFTLPVKSKSNKIATEKQIQQRVARSLILQINCVAPILVFRNEVRTQLNHKAVSHKAEQIGQAPIVCVAQDACKGKPIEDRALIKKLLELSDSKTEHLPGLLPLVPGMPVILTQNIAIELGLINGVNGIFRQLVYQEDSVSTDIISEEFSKNARYVHRPLYALVEITKSKIECNLEQLQPKLIPIPVMEQTFRVDIGDILPKDKKPKSNGKAVLSIKRRALPLVPAYCITTHKSQGQTLNKVVIDLKLPNETDDIAAVYVPLSRRIAQRRALLVIKCDPNALTFIDNYLNEIEYPHSFNRHQRDLAQYRKWKASQLRTFMMYIAMPVLVRLRLVIPHAFPEVYVSHFSLLFIYIRVLRHFDDRDEILQVPVFINSYLRLFSSLYDKCKELFSVHALCHLWQQVLDHGGLAYHSLFASKSCLQHFAKLANGSIALGEQISFWWSVFSQIQSKQVQYCPALFTNEHLINDRFFDFNMMQNYQQEFNLVYNQMFGIFPDVSLKYYCRYRRGLSLYHSLMYNRRKNCNSYNVRVNIDTDNTNSGAYYTPQVKRKRLQEQVDDVPEGSSMEDIKIIKNMFKDLNRKVDILTEQGSTLEKKLDNVDKQMQNYNGRYILSGIIIETPAGLMKTLINQLFTKEEIIDRQHEQINERTMKIKGNQPISWYHCYSIYISVSEASNAYFYNNDNGKIEGFWNNQGKIVRGN
ncbi:unnamed protein product [Rotaria sp. Silwood1]|nr:unnamed protein product [Rotaria sp. Silwood1]CAF4654357.1 unnamed protein product [Rotaria sp. Silwood1]